uniref:Uncharacterized protein n=1 Tax=Ananas comosus var. bracteatus TaxID=296719 RepID=A0A6V7QPY9_ANACO|nr:unnamed protein product [Ananas comosus var. bracteatus]
MERLPALDEEEGEESVLQRRGIFSCWGRLRLSAVWRRLKRFQSERGRSRGNKLYTRRGSLNYDPLSYAQNFDDGGFEGTRRRGANSPELLIQVCTATSAAGIQSQRTKINLMD